MGDGLENGGHSEETAIQEKPEETHRQNSGREIEQMRLSLKDNLSSQVLFMMNTCIRCGICLRYLCRGLPLLLFHKRSRSDTGY